MKEIFVYIPHKKEIRTFVNVKNSYVYVILMLSLFVYAFPPWE